MGSILVDVQYMCDLHEWGNIFSIILYVESVDMPIRVIQSDEEINMVLKPDSTKNMKED